MPILPGSHVADAWIASEGATTPLRPAAPGAVVAQTGSDGSGAGATFRHTRGVGLVATDDLPTPNAA